MSTLKLLQEQQGRAVIKPAGFKDSQPSNQSTDFPHSQYFQIHFRQMHENIRGVQDELKQLRRDVADLDVKLDQLTALLIDRQATLSGHPYLSAQQNSNKSRH
ncbi:MAG: hypothetical protein M0Q44_19755 [Methylobacter sp.]|jgi:hypothetical protein|nr:hypothetical protein [Methylobacter sp.]